MVRDSDTERAENSLLMEPEIGIEPQQHGGDLLETQSAAYCDQRVIPEMGKYLRAPEWSVKQKLALTGQRLAAEGHESGLAGQMSARAEPPGSFWTLKFGLGFDEATEDTLIRVDDDLITREGDGIPQPATRFHLWVSRTRPDVHRIVHTHPPYISTLSMVGEPLAVAHMDATPCFDDYAYLADWLGLPIADEDGRTSLRHSATHGRSSWRIMVNSSPVPASRRPPCWRS